MRVSTKQKICVTSFLCLLILAVSLVLFLLLPKATITFAETWRPYSDSFVFAVSVDKETYNDKYPIVPATIVHLTPSFPFVPEEYQIIQIARMERPSEFLAYKGRDFYDTLQKVVQTRIPNGETLRYPFPYHETVVVKYLSAANEYAVLEVRIKNDSGKKIPGRVLQNQLIGKNKQDAEKILKKYIEKKRFVLELSPSWQKSMPRLPFRIFFKAL